MQLEVIENSALAVVNTRVAAVLEQVQAAETVSEAGDTLRVIDLLREYARQAEDAEAERQVRIARLVACRKLGELCRELEKAQGERTDLADATSFQVVTKSQALKEAGIGKQLAHRCERLLEFSEEEFAQLLERPRVPGLADAVSELARLEKVATLLRQPVEPPLAEPRSGWSKEYETLCDAVGPATIAIRYGLLELEPAELEPVVEALRRLRDLLWARPWRGPEARNEAYYKKCFTRMVRYFEAMRDRDGR